MEYLPPTLPTRLFWRLKMKIEWCFITLMLLILGAGPNTFGQTSICGYVADSLSNERLIGASIQLTESGNTTITNAYGYFCIKHQLDGMVAIEVRYVGYLPLILNIDPEKEKQFNIKLVPNANIAEVSISNQKNILKNSETGVTELSIKTINEIPALGGETDIMKALQLTPGVTYSNEGKSGLYVRGGTPDQNLIILDDVPLYYVNHLGGFVSVFNTDALKNVKLIKGGFPARYGNRLSSIVDVRMKDGDKENIQGRGNIGLISSKISLEGPIKRDTASYILSLRRFMLDLFMRPVTYLLLEKTAIGYTFHDINFKINHKINKKNHIYLSLYHGNDAFSARVNDMKKNDYRLKGKYSWGNLLGAIRWNHTFNSGLFANTTIYYTRYKYWIDYDQELANAGINYRNINNFKSGINDLCIKTDLQYMPAGFYTIRVGGSITNHLFSPSKQRFKVQRDEVLVTDTILNNLTYLSWAADAYLENEFYIGSSFSANIGLRYSHYIYKQTTYQYLEPRLVINHKLNATTSLKYAVSNMQQHVHLLASTGIGMPTDLWVLSTDKIPPQNAWQYSIGLYKQLSEKPYEVQIEAYYKSMQNLIDYKEGASLLGGNREWMEKVETKGIGTSYGLEVMLQKTKGKTNGWIAGTLAYANRQFENINNGNPYPFTYDRRLDINIFINRKFTKNLNGSLIWVFNTGNAFTFPSAYYKVLNDKAGFNADIGYDLETEVEIYDSKNSYRFKPYHRLDVGINHKKMKKKGERTLSAGIYNVYNRQNAFFYFVGSEKTDINGNEIGKQLYQQSYFPIIPYVSYGFKF